MMDREEQILKDERFMKLACVQASYAKERNEVPIGCVIVRGDEVIGRGYNRRNTDQSVLAHAEIMAISEACKVLGDWRLEGCTMYVTLEPCSMCAGALVQARIDEVVSGVKNPKGGCAGSVLDLFSVPGLNHQIRNRTGILEEECKGLLEDFFSELRMEMRVKKEREKRITVRELLTTVRTDPKSFFTLWENKEYEYREDADLRKDCSCTDVLFDGEEIFLVLGVCKDKSMFLAGPGKEELFVTASGKGRKDSLAFRLAHENVREKVTFLPYPKNFRLYRLRSGRGSAVKDPEGYKSSAGEKLFVRLISRKNLLDEQTITTV